MPSALHMTNGVSARPSRGTRILRLPPPFRAFAALATVGILGIIAPALGISASAGVLPAKAAAQAPDAATPRNPTGDTAAVSAVLDDFHDAASRADGDAYFALFADGGVFIGTDPGERWTVPEFRAYARPYFQRGQGWTYVPAERHVRISGDGSTAWFDEMLRNEGLGLTRGSGVLVLEDGAWKLAQYHLTIPVPNEIAGEVVERIRALEER